MEKYLTDVTVGKLIEVLSKLDKDLKVYIPVEGACVQTNDFHILASSLCVEITE